MSDEGRTDARYRGEKVSLWNTAAAGPPSAERVRQSIDEAHAALERLAKDGA